MGLKIESFQSGWSSLLKVALAKELAVKTLPSMVCWLSELSEKLAFNVYLIQNDGPGADEEEAQGLSEKN